MSFARFLQQNWGEMLTLLRQHLALVLVSTLVAVFIGIPTGILLTRKQSLRSPVLGVANVISVGVTTIAAAVGAGGLGVYIFRGLRQYDNNLLLAGAVPAALMALAADFSLGLLEQRFSVDEKRRASALQKLGLVAIA